MKKIKFSPLKMDSKTIAKLDSEQLEKIKGGNNELATPGTSGACTRNSCRTGTSCSGSSLEQSADL
jgi:natural product precursor